MKIVTKWVKHLKDKEHQKEFCTRLYAAKDVLARLSDIIEEDMRAAHTVSSAKDSYKSPNWAHIQADHIGETRAYTRILKIIDLEGNKNV